MPRASYQEIREIADEGTFAATLNERTGIIGVVWQVNGITFEGQTSTGIDGIYAVLINNTQVMDVMRKVKS